MVFLVMSRWTRLRKSFSGFQGLLFATLQLTCGLCRWQRTLLSNNGVQTKPPYKQKTPPHGRVFHLSRWRDCLRASPSAFYASLAPAGFAPNQTPGVLIPPQKKKPPHKSEEAFLVEVEGFEPPTPCSQSRCASRTAPHLDIIKAFQMNLVSRTEETPAIGGTTPRMQFDTKHWIYKKLHSSRGVVSIHRYEAGLFYIKHQTL